MHRRGRRDDRSATVRSMEKAGGDVGELAAHARRSRSILLPLAALGEPIKLKLAYYSSDQTRSYIMADQAFRRRGQRRRAGRPNNRDLYRWRARQGLLASRRNSSVTGVADIAYVVLGPAAEPVPETTRSSSCPAFFAICGKPLGSTPGCSLRGIVRGYDDFFVVGAFATEPETIHTRVPDCIARRT